MAAEKQILTLDEFFTGQADSRQLFDALLSLIHTIGPAEIRVTKSQVAFWRQRAFAWAWMPGKFLQSRTAPLVLTIALRRLDPSPRWKQIVEPRPGRFTHHLELYSRVEIDNEVHAWLLEAWQAAE